MKLLTLLAGLVIIFSSTLHASSRSARFNLSKAEAEQRKLRISQLHYGLHFDLTAADQFSGRQKIDFQLAQADQALNIDFHGGKVEHLVVNGTKRKVFYNGFFITLPATYLRPGPNQVEINFTHPYSNNGDGLYQFIDPVDGKRYHYSNLEPYNANEIFPLFDQPDLKARYTMSVRAPKDFTVIANKAESAVTNGDNDTKLWHFPKSWPFSSYIFALHAGPYHVWEARFRIPLKLYARQSMAAYVQPKDWFDMTKKGFDYFESYFGVPYPYEKYDQILVPDFNAGAMENIGAVTFNESYLSRGQVTLAQKRRMWSTLLHEMAHMWFGNLVTMKWWNDLWLNESFATFMATKALEEVADYDRAWEGFSRWATTGAYRLDESITSHPISTPVPDTNQATANFDAITYGKGASVLRQLEHRIGKDAFRMGLMDYFTKHQHGNTALVDFMKALQGRTQKPLDHFLREYVETRGVNPILARFECHKGMLTKTILEQQPDKHQQMLRHHSGIVFSVAKDPNGKWVEKKQNYDFSSSSHVIPSTGKDRCPAFVFANHMSLDYAKVVLDDKSLRSAASLIGSFESTLLRSQLFIAMEDAFLDGQMPLPSFADLLKNRLAKEQDLELLRALGSSTRRLVGYALAVQEPEPRRAEKIFESYGKLIKGRLAAAAPQSDEQKFWFDLFADLASQKQTQKLFTKLLAGESVFPGLKLDQDMRWQMIQRMADHRLAVTWPLLAAEKKRDSSHKGRLASKSIEIRLADAREQKEVVKAALDTNAPLSARQRKLITRVVGGYRNPHFRWRSWSSIEKHLADYIPFADPGLAGRLTSALTPDSCRPEAASLIRRWAVKHTDHPAPVIKAVRRAIEDIERCLQIKKRSGFGMSH